MISSFIIIAHVMFDVLLWFNMKVIKHPNRMHNNIVRSIRLFFMVDYYRLTHGII